MRPGDVLTVGDVYDVTNHYITLETHPCYGTTRRTITDVTGSSFYLDGDRIGWPRARDLRTYPDGKVELIGHPKDPTALFLTLEQVDRNTENVGGMVVHRLVAEQLRMRTG